jgi:hypothetical protein
MKRSILLYILTGLLVYYAYLSSINEHFEDEVVEDDTYVDDGTNVTNVDDTIVMEPPSNNIMSVSTPDTLPSRMPDTLPSRMPDTLPSRMPEASMVSSNTECPKCPKSECPKCPKCDNVRKPVQKVNPVITKKNVARLKKNRQPTN